MHSLIHLPRFVLIHGPLDNFSCFRYENYLHELKKSIKYAKYSLQEAFNRILEKQKIINNNLWSIQESFTLKNEIINNVHLQFFNLSANLFKQIVLNKYNITIDISKEKDKFLMLKNNSFVIVQQIVQVLNEEPFVIVKQIVDYKEFTNKSMSSVNIGMYILNTYYKVSNNIKISMSDTY